MTGKVKPDLSIRQMMVGQGPTLSDFSSANPYCSDRLSMSVQWLVGNKDAPYATADAARTMCFLSKDVIPVYILYSHGENINITQTDKIATTLGKEGKDLFLGKLSDGPVGPVVVVTEMDFDKSMVDKGLTSKIADQVRSIDSKCGNDRANNQIHCMVAVGIKMGDVAALDAVMNELGTDKDKVDLVAYGINNNYVHTCDASNIRQQATVFSSYSLYTWGKPTIIPYVMFDNGGQDIDKSCTWSESAVVSGYGGFFPLAITSLQKRGVVGIAPYSFNTTGTYSFTNPLGCADCGVARSEARLKAWYGGCQSYTAVSRGSKINPSGGTGIIFSSQSGGVCNQNTQLDFIGGTNFNGKDIMQPLASEIQSPVPKIFSCDACLLTKIKTNDLPFALSNKGGTPPELYCTGFPEIDQWANARNLDPMLVRAFVLTESNFTQCAASKVCSKEYMASHPNAGCFPADGSGNSECYSSAYDEIYDPAGFCDPSLLPNAVTPSPGKKIDWRWCAMGLMQTIEPPYTFWPSAVNTDNQDGPSWKVLEKSGFWKGKAVTADSLDAIKKGGCNPKFNPFNPDDSACLGTLKIERMLKDSRKWVSDHQGLLGWSASNIDANSLFAAYVAGNKYAGFWDSNTRSSDYNKVKPGCSSGFSNGECWAQGFADSRAIDSKYCSSEKGKDDKTKCKGGNPRSEPPYYCYGYTDIIKYIHDCGVPFLSPAHDPGAEKVNAFLYLSQGCSNNFCPDGKKLADELCKADGSGQYNHDLCTAPGVPKVPQSGTYYLPDEPPKK